MRAWLVTWEWAGEHAAVDEKVAAVLNPRLSGERVREIVELLYVNARLSLCERLVYARSKRSTPYRAYFGSIGRVPWTGEVICGHNPYLRARVVDNLRVRQRADGEEELLWMEPPRPTPPSVSSS